MSEILAVAQVFPSYSGKIAPYNTNLVNPDNGNFFPDASTLSGGFPENLGLPKSTALMNTKEENNKVIVEYLLEVPAYGMGTGSVPYNNYRYPPELLYWANTGIRVNDYDKEKVEFPKSVESWADDSKWGSTWVKNGTVSSTTRSIALMKQVNYGTAQLASTVQVSSQTLKDNKSGIFPGEEDQVIDVSSRQDAFLVTGIFIGGVPDVVGWDFLHKETELPTGMTDNKYDKLIYDRIPATGFGFSKSAKFHTLTWDSYRPKTDNTGNYIGPGEQDDQTAVYVALELVNNTGQDLWGELNLIRNGGTFYLVGKLDLTKATNYSSLTFPDEKYFHYPPFNDKGETVEIKRVFMQDYKTEASFQLGENSLKSAYMTIPDLRSSQISLGLSVDLEWQPGLDFSVTLGQFD
jgi:hypothetical protein